MKEIEIVYGVTRQDEWVVPPKVETYFSEGQALDRFVFLRRCATIADMRMRETLGKDYECRVFHHIYNRNCERDIRHEQEFYSKAYDRINYPELPEDIPLQRPLFFLDIQNLINQL